jgi:gluconokinase
MGVSGCGKSSAATAVASRLALPLIEGDHYHPLANVQKMQAGQALNDLDRADWLSKLADLLTQHPSGVAMTCSALKRGYRDQLRSSRPGLRFVFLALSPAVARQRVSVRGNSHFMPSSLVDSQFADLESPEGEDGVLTVEATRSTEEIAQAVAQWIESDGAPKSRQ